MRIDRRITTEDILDRINPSFGTTMDELETRRAAFRDKFHLAYWDSHIYGVVVFKLKAAGIDPGLNSTRGLTPGLPFVDSALASPEAEALAYELDLRTRSPPIEARMDYPEYFPKYLQEADELANYGP